MNKGFLSNYFKGIAAKYLSAVETHPENSNQHEFNGIAALKTILGESRHTFESKILYLGSDESDIISTQCTLTWYDARENHPTRSEYRLYFQTNAALEQADIGDLLVIGLTTDDTLFVVIAKAETTFESQLRWLFALDELGELFDVRKIEDDNDFQLNFAFRHIFDELGIEIKETADDFLDLLIKHFGDHFPTTRDFSAFARSTFDPIDVSDNPDSAIVNWIDHEEMLFRTFERHLVSQKLHDGFNEDVDEFISYSLSVQNRRKSRAGFALENHLEHIFLQLDIKYSRGQITENRAKPDFIFPGITQYHDNVFPSNKLTMLGVKSTCKDRWRQVLSEAAKIDKKHLFTLEPSISSNQTDEMIANKLQLVLPESLHNSYHESQRNWLINLAEFISVIKNRQAIL
jgi:hypothetical protein